MKEIQSVNRVFDILEALAGERYGLTVSNLARKVGLNTTTVYHIASTAMNRGYIEQDPETKRYRLGSRLVQLGSALLSEWDLYRCAIPVMEEVERRCNESVYLGVLQGFEVIEIARVAGTRRLSVLLSMNVGSAHCTALGKTLLAFAGDEKLDDYATTVGLKSYSDKSLTDLELLKEELRRVRGAGYAVDDEEYEAGLSCIGAPVRNHSGRVIASLAVALPKVRYLDERKELLINLVVCSANELSERLGYFSAAKEQGGC